MMCDAKVWYSGRVKVSCGADSRYLTPLAVRYGWLRTVLVLHLLFFVTALSHKNRSFPEAEEAQAPIKETGTKAITSTLLNASLCIITRLVLNVLTYDIAHQPIV